MQKADPLRQELDLGNCNDAAGVKSLLMTLVPGVQLEIEDGDLFLVVGSKEMVEQCLELIRQLNLPLDRVSIRAQLVGLSPTEQETLGLTWRRAAIGNAAGITLMEHFQAQTDLPIVDLQTGQCLSKEWIAESGSTKELWWTDSFAQHSTESGQLRTKLAPVGLDLEVTPCVKSDYPHGTAVCPFLEARHGQSKSNHK